MIYPIFTLQLILRWTARIISASFALFWLLIMLDIIACDVLIGMICIDWEMGLLIIFAAASMLSVLLAWHKDGLGGLVMLIWGIVFASFAFLNADRNPATSMLISGVPFFIAGIFFLTSWSLSRELASNK